MPAALQRSSFCLKRLTSSGPGPCHASLAGCMNRCQVQPLALRHIAFAAGQATVSRTLFCPHDLLQVTWLT